MVTRPRESELMSWTDNLNGDSGGTAETFCTGKGRVLEVSEATLAHLKDVFAASDELP